MVDSHRLEGWKLQHMLDRSSAKALYTINLLHARTYDIPIVCSNELVSD
jgi:hypothetical protein